jgi:hypothetical protein
LPSLPMQHNQCTHPRLSARTLQYLSCDSCSQPTDSVHAPY